MSRSKTPTERDQRRLELFHRFLKGDDLKITCGCEGEDEQCSECDIELTADDLYVRHHNRDRLSLRVSLSNLDPESKLAVRYNADDEFADAVDSIDDQLGLSLTQPGDASPDDRRKVENFMEAAELISRIKGARLQELDKDLKEEATRSVQEA